MIKIGLFHRTQTSNTQTAVEMVQKEFGSNFVVTLHDISKTEPSDLQADDYIIISWTTGLQKVMTLMSLKSCTTTILCF
jgi:flavodoxin I